MNGDSVSDFLKEYGYVLALSVMMVIFNVPFIHQTFTSRSGVSSTTAGQHWYCW